MKNHFFISMLAAVALLGGLTACNGKLDKAPRADKCPKMPCGLQSVSATRLPPPVPCH